MASLLGCKTFDEFGVELARRIVRSYISVALFLLIVSLLLLLLLYFPIVIVALL
jgi:hypothetical protein